MAVSKIRAAIAGMAIANNGLNTERFIARRRLSSEDTITGSLKPTGINSENFLLKLKVLHTSKYVSNFGREISWGQSMI